VLNLFAFLAVASGHIADRRALLALMLCPEAAFCLMSGQSLFLTAVMLTGILGFLDRRPLIGLLTVKPQLGLLLPVVLVGLGRWCMFTIAAVTALALTAALLFGTRAWVNFVTQRLLTQNVVRADPEGIAAPFYPTIFMNLHGIGLPCATAKAVQLCFTVAAVVAVAWAFPTHADANPHLSFALFVTCSIAAVHVCWSMTRWRSASPRSRCLPAARRARAGAAPGPAPGLTHPRRDCHGPDTIFA
jgi:Glycosyltransferase family 87